MLKTLLISSFSFLFLLIGAGSVSAACSSSVVSVIARDQNGEYIPNINFEIYDQTVDVDNKPKPGPNRIAGGKTSAILGIGSATFVPKMEGSSKDYALKLWDKNSKIGEFWYYDQIDLNCSGSNVTVTEVLSGIRLAFYNPNGDLLKNLKGSLYTQRFDIENNPIKETQDLVGTFDTSSEGAAYFYLGGRQFDLDNNSTGLYAVDISNVHNVLYKKYGIALTNDRTSHINYILSETHFNLKDSVTNAVLPNYKIEIYKQDYSDTNEKMLGTRLKDITTDSKGVAVLESPEGLFALRIKNFSGEYKYFWEREVVDQRRTDYDIKIASNASSTAEEKKVVVVKKVTPVATVSKTTPKSVIGSLSLHVVGNGGNQLKSRSVVIYSQKKENNKIVIDKKIKESKTDNSGNVKFDIASGVYAVSVRDDLSKQDILYNFCVDGKGVNTKTVKIGGVNLSISDSSGKSIAGNIDVYKLVSTGGNNYKRGDKLKTLNVAKQHDFVMASAPYLFIIRNEVNDYGQALYVDDSGKQVVKLRVSSSMEVGKDKIFTLKPFIRAINSPSCSAANPLLGRILLQVESHGEAYYVHPDNNQRFYLKDGEAAYKMMRGFGLGITNSNLAKISVGVDPRFNKNDADADGLADALEAALGTKPDQEDSDLDDYIDGVEVKGDYNPLGSGKMAIDENAASKLKGKIVLQVESHGEAWYINPTDGKRYYMGNGAQAYEIMRFLSLGVKNSVLSGIPEGKL